jgi:hypothetical protein
VTGDGSLALAVPGIPNLDHAVIGRRHHAQGIARKGPDALHVSKHGFKAFASRRVPLQNHAMLASARKGLGGLKNKGRRHITHKPDSAVETARHDIPRR